MRTLTILLVLFIVGLVGFVAYSVKIVNPRVAQELRDSPNGIRAERVMLMTIGDRKTIPVNYLREGERVFIGADGPWWREMQDEGQPVVMLIKGEILAGQARAVTDRPDHTRAVFERLRPDTPEWLPDWLRGVLIEVEIGAVRSVLPGPDSGQGRLEAQETQEAQEAVSEAADTAEEMFEKVVN